MRDRFYQAGHFLICVVATLTLVFFVLIYWWDHRKDKTS